MRRRRGDGLRGPLLPALLTWLVLAAPLAAAQQAPPWPDGAYNWFGHSPIRVYVDATNLTVPEYLDQARAAMRYWERGGNERARFEIRFEEVQDRAEADIVLWFRDEARAGPLCLEDERALGCARPFERPVPIEVLTRRKDGSYVSYQLMREVTEHELGHALGFPHSPIPGDIMAAHASTRAGASWRPGDLPRLLGGAAVLLALLAGGVFLLLRTMRPRLVIEPLGPDGPDGFCPQAQDGRHAFVPVDVPGAREAQVWQVCHHCRAGYPAEP